MKPVYTSVSAAVLTLCLSAPAFAADLGGLKDSPSSDPITIGQSWTGPWVALLAGYGILTATPSGEDYGASAQGGFGEVQAGYDRQFGNFVAGVYLCASYSMIEDLGEGYCADARVGVLLNKDTLAYASGGWRWQSVTDYGDKVFASGGELNLGLESRLTKSISLKIEGGRHWITDVDGESVPDGVDLSDNRIKVGFVNRF